MEGKTNRLLALEGLRGIAAVIVVLFHALVIFYPSFFYGPDYFVNGVHPIRFEDNLFGSPLGVFLSGPFAVAVFFVISGFVLTIGFFQTNDQMIIKKLAAKRYIRLMLPALASILLVWLILTFGLDAAKNHIQPITLSGWLESVWKVVPNLSNALTQGLWGVVATGEVNYNPVLWTIRYEILGSILVFAVSILFKQSNRRWIIYALLIALTFNTWYLGFVLGMIVADLYASKKFPFALKHNALMVGGLVVGLFLGGYPTPSVHTGGTIYQAVTLGWLNEAQNQSLYLTIGAVLVLTSVLAIGPLRRLFESKYLSTLGKYTYSLYLTHMAVLFTVCAGIFMLLFPILGYNKAAIVSILATIPALMIVAYLFEKYIDAPSIRISGVFSNWLLGIPQKEGVAAYSSPSRRLSVGSLKQKAGTFVSRLRGRKS